MRDCSSEDRLPRRYPPITAAVGDTIRFEYAAPHNVYRLLNAESCPATPWNSSQALEEASSSVGGGAGALPNRYDRVLVELGCASTRTAAPFDSWISDSIRVGGGCPKMVYCCCRVYTFACQADDHCMAGMRVTVTVRASSVTADDGGGGDSDVAGGARAGGDGQAYELALGMELPSTEEEMAAFQNAFQAGEKTVHLSSSTASLLASIALRRASHDDFGGL